MDASYARAMFVAHPHVVAPPPAHPAVRNFGRIAARYDANVSAIGLFLLPKHGPCSLPIPTSRHHPRHTRRLAISAESRLRHVIATVVAQLWRPLLTSHGAPQACPSPTGLPRGGSFVAQVRFARQHRPEILWRGAPRLRFGHKRRSRRFSGLLSCSGQTHQAAVVTSRRNDAKQRRRAPGRSSTQRRLDALALR